MVALGRFLLEIGALVMVVASAVLSLPFTVLLRR